MKIIFIILLLWSYANNAIADIINQASITTHSYQLKRDGLWAIPAVSKNLTLAKNTQVILALNGDIKGFEYQLKYATLNKKTTLQTLFYIIDLNDYLSIQIGKFIENWQLGYAFNPLGLTDPYHPINNTDDLNEKLGINAIAVRYQLENVYLDFYLSNDTKSRDNIRGYGYKSRGARLNYILDENTDISLVVHKKSDLSTGFGAGFRRIIGDNTKLYGSFFTRHGTIIPNVSHKNREKDGNQYTNIMLGWHYTSDNNISLIAEINQDDRGLSPEQYKTLTVENLNLVRPNGIRQRYIFWRLGKIINDHELSFSRRSSEDKSALNILEWRYNLTANLQLNTTYSITTGTTGSEYKSYFPEQQKSSLVLHYYFDF